MTLKPENVVDLSNSLICANTRGEKVLSVDLAAMNRLLEHKSEDMTATVEAGMTLAAFQNAIAKLGQWLPIDPPNADQLTIAELLSQDENGPRRFGFGTIRDYLIGIKVILADGRVISAGGKVVKNVAGYDLAKLFIGSHGSLGVIVEATFKLRPLSETEMFVAKTCKNLEEADAVVEAVLNSELTPIVLDLHNLSPVTRHLSLLLGFAGTKEEVEWQLAKARELGFAELSSLDYAKHFWADKKLAQRISVLPSKTIETLRSLNNTPFIARAGNGIIYHLGEPVPPNRELPKQLMQRLKNEFDPKNILPELPL